MTSFITNSTFFLNAKGSVSPDRNAEAARGGSVKVSRKTINFTKNRLYEETANGDVTVVQTEKKGIEKGSNRGRVVRGSYLLN